MLRLEFVVSAKTRCRLKIVRRIFLPSFLLTFLACGLFSGAVSAATIAAKSCSLSDVQSAVNSAARGDTVIVPSGTCTWSGGIVTNKALTLTGSGIDRTIILGNYAIDKHLISFEPLNNESNNGYVFRVSNMTIDAQFKSGSIRIWYYDSTPLVKFRIDHNKFLGCRTQTQSGLWLDNTLMLSGNIEGVVDSNAFRGSPSIRIYGYPGAGGKNNWEYTRYAPGSSQGVYFEDNIVLDDNSQQERVPFMSSGGGLMVVRYNDVTINSPYFHTMFDMHPNLSSTVYASVGTEGYGNKFTLPSGKIWGLFACRGGKNLVFYNRILTSYQYQPWTRVLEETSDSVSTTSHICPPGTLYAGSKSCAFDGSPQHVNRSYFFNNRAGTSGAGWIPTVHIDKNSSYVGGLIENKHFWKDSASFSGAAGIGCGRLIDRPTKCTEGVGYWATNQSCHEVPSGTYGVAPSEPLSGTLYVCGSNNTWNNYFTPYTYPHPLRSEEIGIGAPRNFKVADLN